MLYTANPTLGVQRLVCNSWRPTRGIKAPKLPRLFHLPRSAINCWTAAARWASHISLRGESNLRIIELNQLICMELTVGRTRPAASQLGSPTILVNHFVHKPCWTAAARRTSWGVQPTHFEFQLRFFKHTRSDSNRRETLGQSDMHDELTLL